MLETKIVDMSAATLSLKLEQLNRVSFFQMGLGRYDNILI